MSQVTSADRRRAEEFVGTLKWRGTSMAEIPDSAAPIIEGVAKEFAAIRQRSYFQGIREGISRFAWWKDGEQFIGTTGRKLRQALDEVDTQESEERH